MCVHSNLYFFARKITRISLNFTFYFCFFICSLSCSQSDVTVIEKYKKWKYVVDNPKDFTEVFSFFYDNPHWPLFDKTVKTAESCIPNISKRNELEKWFKRYHPTTSKGITAYSEILLKTNKKLAIKYISQTWIYQNLSSKFASEYREAFKKYISLPDDAKRIKRLVAKKDFDQIKMMKQKIKNPLISKYIKKYINEHKQNKPQPFDYKDQEARYNAVKLLIKKNQYKKASKILLASNNGEETNPIDFFNQRRHVACELLRDGSPLNAYNVLSMHKLSKFYGKHRKSYIKAEWLLGFITYKFLRNFNKALKHFKNAYEFSDDVMHKSKNAFWTAESYMNKNDSLTAFNWYKKASKYFNTFYGQLAYERLMTLSKDRLLIYNQYFGTLLNEKDIPAETELNFNNRELVVVLKVLAKYNTEKNVKYLIPFYKQLIDEIEDPLEESLLVNLASTKAEIDFIVLEESKKQKYIKNRKAFKILPDNQKKYVFQINADPCFLSLVHAIIHKESNFNQKAKSHVGAIGLMQIMPSTAKYELKSMKFFKNTKESLYAPRKNISIGSFFLNRLLKKYGNDLVYTIAAYNAGEGGVAKFKKNTRKLKNLTPIDVIELIPYKETRLYVKNVLSSLAIYQILLDAGYCYDCSTIAPISK